MNQNFQIGDFCFRITTDEAIPVPGNFMKFTAGADAKPVYTYRMHVVDQLPAPAGRLIAERQNMRVYQTTTHRTASGDVTVNCLKVKPPLLFYARDFLIFVMIHTLTLCSCWRNR